MTGSEKMDIQMWSVLLNAVIGVLLVVYGIWLRNIVRHQLSSKDSTIESLGAAIKANEAEIARLRNQAAPAIADSYRRMKELADGLAAESNDLAARLKAMESERSTDALQYLRDHAQGFNEAARIVGRGFEDLSRRPHPTNSIGAQELVDTVVRISQNLNARSYELVKSLQDAQNKK